MQTCLPGYELATTVIGGGSLPKRWGYSFDTIVDMVKDTIVEVIFFLVVPWFRF